MLCNDNNGDNDDSDGDNDDSDGDNDNDEIRHPLELM